MILVSKLHSWKLYKMGLTDRSSTGHISLMKIPLMLTGYSLTLQWDCGLDLWSKERWWPPQLHSSPLDPPLSRLHRPAEKTDTEHFNSTLIPKWQQRSSSRFTGLRLTLVIQDNLEEMDERPWDVQLLWPEGFWWWGTNLQSLRLDTWLWAQTLVPAGEG